MPKALKICTVHESNATGTGSTQGPVWSGEKAFQACVTGTGAVSSTVVVQCSVDPTVIGWATLGTITLNGTTTTNDGFVSNGAWPYYRANITTITGTAAYVTLKLAQE